MTYVSRIALPSEGTYLSPLTRPTLARLPSTSGWTMPTHTLLPRYCYNFDAVYTCKRQNFNLECQSRCFKPKIGLKTKNGSFTSVI